MNELEKVSFEELCRLYNKYFSLGYLGADGNEKLACISLVCVITKTIQEKGKNVNCYDILLNICKDYSDFQKNTVLKALGAVCQDFLYGCKVFPDFGLEPKQMPKKVRELLENRLPF